VSVLNIQAKNQIPSGRILFHLLGRVSDRVLVIGDSELHHEALDVLAAEGCAHEALPEPEEPESYAADLLRQAEESTGTRVLLIPLTGDSNGLGYALSTTAKEHRFKVVFYFKSIHDAGAGLTAPLPEAHAVNASGKEVSFFRRWLGGTRTDAPADKPSKPKKKKKPDVERADAVLAFNGAHGDVLLAKGYDPDVVFQVGYPLLYPEWKTLVRSSVETTSPGSEPACRVTLFTRGETPGRPPEENVMPHETLRVILDDVFETLDRVCDRYQVRVKPHPIQDLKVLKEILGGRENVEIVFDPPSVLAATSDLAVSTYSSTVLDALIFGVPSIEYLIENDFFRKKHPRGSPFPGMGALRANDGREFESCVRKALDPEYQVPDVSGALDHRMDLSVFEQL
jgi:hypothetical protein